MKLLFLTWKDLKHPLAGGAEVVNEALARRMAADGHEVKLLVGGFAGGAHQETIDGYDVVRVGSRFTVYPAAFRYYQRKLRGWADVVIDEVNTIPFFAKWYVREKNVLFIHQLAREIWFYQMPFPVSAVGYALEPMYLRLLNNLPAITVSDSSRDDILRHGFRPQHVEVISEGIEMTPLATLGQSKKYVVPTVLSLGALRPMKQTLDQVKAFEIAKKTIPDLQLKIAGDASDVYGQKVLDYCRASEFADAIEYLGRVSPDEKKTLMRKAHLLLATSVKEGWGLVVTEAASQGTPSVVYDADGLRDSVKNGETGIVTAKNPTALAAGITTLLTDKLLYQKMQQSAWEMAKTITFDRCYADFMTAIRKA